MSAHELRNALGRLLQDEGLPLPHFGDAYDRWDVFTITYRNLSEGAEATILLVDEKLRTLSRPSARQLYEALLQERSALDVAVSAVESRILSEVQSAPKQTMTWPALQKWAAEQRPRVATTTLMHFLYKLMDGKIPSWRGAISPPDLLQQKYAVSMPDGKRLFSFTAKQVAPAPVEKVEPAPVEQAVPAEKVAPATSLAGLRGRDMSQKSRAPLRYEYLINPRIADERRKEITGVIFVGASLDFKSEGFAYSRISKCFFENADLSGADFTNTTITDTSFAGANLKDAQFNQAKLTRVSFAGAKLTGADFFGASADSVVFPVSHESSDSDVVSITSRPGGLVAALKEEVPRLFKFSGLVEGAAFTIDIDL